ncbi:hypothetical protein RFI_02273 [Reticulomyxa filosa]|uniref:Uncharacterized protein n=1 Tax=Reticulomyxa filosa TaxID=46433 RepID=X6P9R3_RETFI|nr:hypothetical protein RFI_02273 [Reticulomyxa filosa]|eukprot:ETO34814.1 hypothetical protein RFI_02273 [Reticulomyxa filosa]
MQYCIKDGKANVTYPNGDTFSGTLANNKKIGSGKYQWSKQKAIYEGNFHEDVIIGKGKFIYPDGSSYEEKNQHVVFFSGEWQNNQRHGQGTYIYSNGDSYSGEWVNGVKNGFGIYTYFSDHSQLVGNWEKNVYIDGKWRLHDNTEYHGSFNHNVPEGDGLFVFANGNQLEGSFTNKEFYTKKIVHNA